MALARFEQTGDVGTALIDAPPLNLFGPDMMRDLRDAIGEARRSDSRAVIFRASGEVFSAGADVHVFQVTQREEAREIVASVQALSHAVEQLPFPTLAVVHGLCLTAGFELSLACDMIWAAESAKFGLVEHVVGVTPFMGGTQRVAERAGPARARELVMTGGLYDSAKLESWGVVNRTVSDDQLLEKSIRFAERLASGPTQAHLATKRVVRAFLDGGVQHADACVSDIVAPLFETRDLQHGVAAFLEHGGPGHAEFEGR